MVDIKVPQIVKERLRDGEKVIGKISSSRFDFYATDNRLFRFKSTSDCRILEYDKISLKFMKYSGAWLILRAFCIIMGVLCIGLGILSFIGPEINTGTTITNFDAPFAYSLLLWVLGLWFLVMGLVLRYGYYQIEGPNIGKKELKRWRIERYRWGSGHVDRFAKAVQERLAVLERNRLTQHSSH